MTGKLAERADPGAVVAGLRAIVEVAATTLPLPPWRVYEGTAGDGKPTRGVGINEGLHEAAVFEDRHADLKDLRLAALAPLLAPLATALIEVLERHAAIQPEGEGTYFCCSRCHAIYPCPDAASALRAGQSVLAYTEAGA